MSWIDNFNNKKNPKHRDNIASAIIGSKRQGKTVLLKIWIDNYVKLYPHRPVLVFDPSDAFGRDDRSGFEGYPIITLDELYCGKKVNGGTIYWERGVRRILDKDEDKDFHNELFAYMLRWFSDGLIVIDEATILFPYNPTKLHRALVIKHTNRNTDMMMVFHRLKAVPTAFRGAIWDYIFFNTDEGYDNYKKIADMEFPRPKEFFAAWKKAQEAPQKEDEIIQFFTSFSLKKKK